MLVCKTISGYISGNGAHARNATGQTNVLIRTRHVCTVRALLYIKTQHGAPLVAIEDCIVDTIVRTLNVRLMNAHKQRTAMHDHFC